MIVFTVTRTGHHAACVAKTIPALLSTIEAEMDGLALGDAVTITLGEMTEEEHAALPEFQGW